MGAALAGTVGSKITAISDNLQTAKNTTNDRLQGAAALRAGYDAYKLVNGGATKATKDADDFRAANGDKSDPNGGSAFGISFSVGSSSSKQSSNTTTSTSRGTTLQAQDIEITATKGDITATGAKLQANNITLDAAQDVNLLAAVNTATIQSSSESHSVGAGVTIGLGKQTGISFQLNASQSNGNANGSETTFDNTLVTATNTLTVKSGGNTNLVGAQLAGNTVKMDVGGDLNIVTLQDKSDFASEQHSSGFGISLCLPPLCAGGAPVTGSINKNDASINHNYQSAKGQSGIAAGSGGYDITVNGNTHLAGGAITSTAPQDQNTLKTGSLTSTDVNNSQTTSSQSTSLSLGYSGGSGTSTLLTNVRTNALANLANLNGGAGMPANGSQSGTTQSVISPGNVTITGTGNAATDANSNTQLATLTGRDASKANGALTNTLTLQQAQQIPAEQQRAAENAQISQLIAPVVFNAVGDIAQKNDWAESSPQKIALHAVAGYVVASASGGNGATGAMAAAANEATTSSISSIVDKAMPIPAGATPAQARQIEADRNVVKETASTLVGIGAVAATGGTNQQMATGGNIALAADQFNRQLHPNERKRIKELANAKAQESCRGSSDCEKQANLYWTDMLERAAEGRVDTQEAIKNQTYYQQIVQASATPGTEAASSGAGVAFFNDLQTAQQLLNSDAGKPILDSTGNPALGTDGKPQTYFNATQAQRDNPYGNIFPGGSPGTQSSVIPGKELRDQERLTRLTTQNGSTSPDTPIEEVLLGMRVPPRAGGAVVKVTSRSEGAALVGTGRAAEQALLRSGGAFDNAGNPLLDMSALTNEQKRVVGEQLFGPSTVRQIVPEGKQIARTQGAGTNGIDELYEVRRPDVDFVNVEYKFVGRNNNTGAQRLENTNDGRQGSLTWITGSNRLENAVGESLAPTVYKAIDAGRFESWVVTIRPDGSSSIQVLDALGKPKLIDTSKIILPGKSLSGAKP